MKRLLVLLLVLASLNFGQFTISSVSSLEHDNVQGAFHTARPLGVALNFLFTYRSDGAGIIRTVAIDKNDAYSMSITGSYGYSSVPNKADLLVIRDSTRAIIAYRGLDDDGFVETLSISADKDVITSIDILEHNGEFASSHIIRPVVDATHFLMTYENVDSDLWVKIIIVDGSFNLSMGDSLRVKEGSVFADFISMEEIGTTDKFAISYTAVGKIRMAIVGIDGSYNLTLYDDIEVGTGYPSTTISIDDTHIFIAYDDGYAKTYSVDGSYLLAEVDAVQFSATVGASREVTLIEFEGHYLVNFTNTDIKGLVQSFNLDESYNITVQADAFEYTTTCNSGTFIQMNSEHTLLLYSGLFADGFLKVLETVPPTLGGWAHKVMSVETPTAVNSASGFIKVNGIE